ncbi:hypothetical protein ON010_g16022 [Phytophthora cinnamomi]|nr:hypothetical protein ON010_g16022 [Phytophthora cinnamomi]
MNKSDDFGPACTKDPKRKKVFLRRLHNQLSESRMLEALDRSLQYARPRTAEIGRQSTELGNQEQEEQDTADGQDEEEELVCVSTMVKMVDEGPAMPKSAEFQAGGVLKTVRYIHRQRAIDSMPQENQAEH